MNKKDTIVSSIVIIAATIIMSIGCSPAPMIQSAHVNSDFKTGMNFTSAFHSMDLNPYYLAVGIKERVELSGAYFLLGGSANMKIFIAEWGNKGLFRNVATAVFAGGKTSLWESTRWKYVNGGIIISTCLHGDDGDVELVFQPSFFRTVNTVHEEGPYHLRGDGVNINCGTILTLDPNRKNTFSSGIRLAVGYQHFMKTKDYYPENTRLDPYYSEWFFEVGLDFNWKAK